MKELVSAQLHDEAFVLERVVDGKQFLMDLRGQPRDVPVSQEIKELARLIGGGRKTFFLFGSRVARVTHGYIFSRLVVDASLLCGQPDNVLFLFEGCNEVGAWELGCAPDRLPGSVVPTDAETLEALRTAWSAPDIASNRGMDAMDMIRAAEKGELKALLLIGVDPLAVFPDTERTQKALSLPDLVVRAGMFPAVGGEVSHVVLPTAAMTETDGTYVSTEGRVQRISKVADPPGHAWPVARFILDLAGRLGSPLGFVTARDIFEEIVGTCPAWSGLSWDNVGQPGGGMLGSQDDRCGGRNAGESCKWAPYLPPDSFPSPPQPPSELPWKVYPEAQTAHPADGVVSRRSYRLGRFGNVPSVRMNPKDIRSIGAKQDTWVVLRSAVGEARVKVIEDAEVPPSGLVIPCMGPLYILQSLLPWPEEYCPPGWDRIHVSITPEET
jgi:predicted molibdopterin-dependent oxidoreductase YjgC